jgi:two-component system, cell cycle response regulator
LELGVAVHIVVADPSRTILKAVAQLLEADGHEVTSFVDGRDALDFIKTHKDVSALITSAELDSYSGLELCWETRLLSGYDRAIYIILMSSNSDPKQLINALDSGADELIRKPPARDELYARLRSADRVLRLQRELIRLAMVDPLTGVFNRRAFLDRKSVV